MDLVAPGRVSAEHVVHRLWTNLWEGHIGVTRRTASVTPWRPVAGAGHASAVLRGDDDAAEDAGPGRPAGTSSAAAPGSSSQVVEHDHAAHPAMSRPNIRTGTHGGLGLDRLRDGRRVARRGAVTVRLPALRRRAPAGSAAAGAASPGFGALGGHPAARLALRRCHGAARLRPRRPNPFDRRPSGGQAGPRGHPGARHRQLRLLRLQPRAVPRRAGRRAGRPPQRRARPSTRRWRSSPTPSCCRPARAARRTPASCCDAHRRRRRPAACRCSACASATRPSATSTAAQVVRGAGADARQDVAGSSHDGAGVFAGLPDPLEATRYHSLVVDARRPARLPRGHRRDGRRHDHGPAPPRRCRVEGVQFHPESILTVGGHDLLRNFLATRRSAPERASVVVAAVRVVVVGGAWWRSSSWSWWSAVGPALPTGSSRSSPWAAGVARGRASGRSRRSGLRRAEGHVDCRPRPTAGSRPPAVRHGPPTRSCRRRSAPRPAAAPVDTTSVTVGALVDRLAGGGIGADHVAGGDGVARLLRRASRPGRARRAGSRPPPASRLVDVGDGDLGRALRHGELDHRAAGVDLARRRVLGEHLPAGWVGLLTLTSVTCQAELAASVGCACVARSGPTKLRQRRPGALAGLKVSVTVGPSSTSASASGSCSYTMFSADVSCLGRPGRSWRLEARGP